jgi:hypothetical protein
MNKIKEQLERQVRFFMRRIPECISKKMSIEDIVQEVICYALAEDYRLVNVLTEDNTLDVKALDQYTKKIVSRYRTDVIRNDEFLSYKYKEWKRVADEKYQKINKRKILDRVNEKMKNDNICKKKALERKKKSREYLTDGYVTSRLRRQGFSMEYINNNRHMIGEKRIELFNKRRRLGKLAPEIISALKDRIDPKE